MFHTNPYILPLKWSAHEPGMPVQHPRDLGRGNGYCRLEGVGGGGEQEQEHKTGHY